MPTNDNHGHVPLVTSAEAVAARVRRDTRTLELRATVAIAWKAYLYFAASIGTAWMLAHLCRLAAIL